jgi:hypothetical protein
MNKNVIGLFASLLLLTPLSGCSLSMSSGPLPESSSAFSSSSASLEPAKSFTITFKNWDRSPLSSVTVERGKDAVYDGLTPTRDPDAQYTYAFSGWNLPLTNIQADGDRIAQYSTSTNQYPITFLNYDGSELEKSSWDYGATPHYSGTPTKPSDPEKSYVFSGWSPEIVPVSGEATYTAQYSVSVPQYTITFKNWDGSLLQESAWDYGSTPVYQGRTPGKATDDFYTYNFSGWDPEIATVSGEATYTALFTKEEIVTEGLVYQSFESGTEVTGYSGKAGKVVIATSFLGRPVVGIGEFAFEGHTGIDSISIPDSITRIRQGAFNGCTGLVSIKIPDSVTIIGDGAFERCTRLTSIVVGAKNPNYQSFDGVLFSKDGRSLIAYPAAKSGSSYTVPDSVRTIAFAAFSYSANLTTVSFPDLLTTISGSAFLKCILTSVTLPRSLLTIGKFAFSNCTHLSAIKIPDAVTEIGESAFSGCTFLQSVKIGKSVTWIGSSAFSGCTFLSLTSIIIPISVTIIGAFAFYNCEFLMIYCEATAQPSGWDSWWKEYGGFVSWYSETDPGSLTSLYHWHYVDGEVTAWKK